MPPRALPGITAIVALSAACSGAPTMVPLLSAAGIPVTQTPSKDVPLEVMTRSTGVRDPLPIEGSMVTLGDVETALGHAISTAAVPWAESHKAKRPEGWQITVELTLAEATFKEGRLTMTLVARATLRTRADRTFLAQTQASCRQGGFVGAPEKGSPVVFSCMEHLGRDLAGWLGQVEP